MANALKEAVRELFLSIRSSKSAAKRVLNPISDGAGTRLYPPKTKRNDEKFGIRIDKGELVHDKPGHVRLKLQINSDAKDKTLQTMAKKDSHKTYASADVDATQDITDDALDKLEQEFLSSVDDTVS